MSAPPAETWAERKILAARFWRTALCFWRGRRAWMAWSLCAALLVLVLAQLGVQILLNFWNGRFFDALERRDAEAVLFQAQVFVPLVALSVMLSALAVYGRMTTQRKWRAAVTRHVVEYWLSDNRFQRIGHVNSGSENPEYRISEDIRLATDAPVDLAMAMVASVLTALTFFGVLWSVGGSLDVKLFGTTWTIPAYLVIAVIIYSTVFTSVMVVVGRKLPHVIEQKNQAEARFRAAADLLARPERGGPGGRPVRAARHLDRHHRGAAPLARAGLAAHPDHAGAAVERAAGAGGRLAAVRAEISLRHHDAGRADPGGGGLRHRAGRLQLAGGQLQPARRLALLRPPRRHAA